MRWGYVALVGMLAALAMATTAFGQAFDLASASPRATLSGAAVGDAVNRLATGDFNGDGVKDVLVGAAHHDGPGRPDGGAAYVVFGGAGLPSGVDLASQAGFTVLGAGVADALGRSVAAGDVNGDGVDDLVLGAQADPAGRANAGAVFIIYGASGLGGVRDLASSAADVTIFGIDPGDDMGADLAVGEINGDGARDLVIGADDAWGPGNAMPIAGEAYVVLGGGLPGTLDLAAVPPFATLYGIDEGDDFGTSVVLANVDGVGADDVIIGADDASGPNNGRLDSGEAYVVFASSLKAQVTSYDLTIYGALAGDNLGAVIAAGDVTGDGLADVVVSADTADPGGRFNAGKVYVVFGGASGTVDLAASPGGVLAIEGDDPSDRIGKSLSASASVNGDGARDLLIGSTNGDGPGNPRLSAGEVYVLYGPLGSGSVAAGSADAIVYGAETGDGLGAGVASADVSPGGGAELIAAAETADGPANSRTNAGEVYVLSLVAPPPPPPTPAPPTPGATETPAADATAPPATETPPGTDPNPPGGGSSPEEGGAPSSGEEPPGPQPGGAAAPGAGGSVTAVPGTGTPVIATTTPEPDATGRTGRVSAVENASAATEQVDAGAESSSASTLILVAALVVGAVVLVSAGGFVWARRRGWTLGSVWRRSR